MIHFLTVVTVSFLIGSLIAYFSGQGELGSFMTIVGLLFLILLKLEIKEE